MNNIITATKWSGENGMNQIIKDNARIMKGPYTGAGINFKKKQKIAILRSVDNIDYYADNLNDPNNVEYTLFGHNGDQNEKEPRFNEPLLNSKKTEHIYLYRVRPNLNKKYMFYGKYAISGRIIKQNRGVNGIMRNVIVLKLTKIND
tara:strand:+ start:54 stop:494 length:441 start_codon:yes stop_codon:yes gene_type:complete